MAFLVDFWLEGEFFYIGRLDLVVLKCALVNLLEEICLKLLF